MYETFTTDLKVARKRSGLLQSDCGYLLGTSNKVVSLLELGHREPTVQELFALSLIYGSLFEQCFVKVLETTRNDLAERLPSLPRPPKDWPRTVARTQTLHALAKRLEVSDVVV